MGQLPKVAFQKKLATTSGCPPINFKMMPLGVDAALGYFRALVNKHVAAEQKLSAVA